jgi:3-hydroxybutyryl-CoA dehydrogenase
MGITYVKEVLNMIFNSVGIIGAGTLGHGIAFTYAKSGCSVMLVDASEAALEIAKRKIEKSLDMFIAEEMVNIAERATILDRITYSTVLDGIDEKEYVVEAISENLESKQRLFKLLDDLCSPETIISSNTSSLQLSHITKDVVKHREKVILAHWFNPAQIVPLVELLRIESTSDDTYNKIKEFHEQCGKVTIEVKKEVPGLIANRLQMAMAREIFSLYEQKVASPEDIDKALSAGPGFRLSMGGFLQIADFGGLDIWLAVSQQLLPHIDSSREPNVTITEKVKQNQLGVKSGQGFFQYPGEDLDAYTFARDEKLLKQLKFLNNLK